MNIPKVSVIIPTHNRSYLLSKAIQSVLSQSFHDFEIIVVDDASQDNTAQIVNVFSDKRIRYIRHRVNKGDCCSRNNGINNTNGEYIAFLDDDDEWFPEKLSMQVSILDNSPLKVGAVHTGSIAVDIANCNELYTRIATMRGNIFQHLLRYEDTVTTSSVLLRKICFEKVGLFDESIAYCSDYDMWLRISKEFDFECIQTPLVKYGIHKNNLGSNYSLQIKGREAVLRKYHQYFLSDSKNHSYVCYTLGILYCFNGNYKKSRKYFLRSIRMNTFWIKPYIFLCLSLLDINIIKKLIEINNDFSKFIHYQRTKRLRQNAT